MESWIRSRSLPVYFAINYLCVLLAFPIVCVVSVFLLHDHMSRFAALQMIITPVVFASGATIFEASRRRGERAARYRSGLQQQGRRSAVQTDAR